MAREQRNKGSQLKIAHRFNGKTSSHGLFLSLNMNNSLNSDDAGVIIPLNGNDDELIYLGKIRNV